MKHKYIVLALLLCVIICGMLAVFKNVPLRTAIYRNYAKQTVFLYSDNDTLYSFGYFGVRQYKINKGKLLLINENDEFCHNCFVGHLIGRSGVTYDNYLYVAARSYIGGIYESDENGYKKGELLVFNKSNLSIIKTIDTDYSMIEVKRKDSLLVVSGLQGFSLYKITKPQEPKLCYSFRTKKAWEFQGVDFFSANEKNYIAFARFSGGLSIYDVSCLDSIKLVCHKPITDRMSDGTLLPSGLHVFRIVIDYPYIYATLAPTYDNFQAANDCRGIMVYDVADIKNVKQQYHLVPRRLYYDKKTGDPQPSHISLYKDKIYTNFGEKGVAVFTKQQFSKTSRFVAVNDVFDGQMILPICIDRNGLLIGGDYNSPTLYTYKLK